MPAWLTGAVVERRTEVGSDEDATERTVWHATGSFKSFTYWNHDTAPVATDTVRRCMEWAALAAHIHAPMDPEDVDRALANDTQATETKELVPAA